MSRSIRSSVARLAVGAALAFAVALAGLAGPAAAQEMRPIQQIKITDQHVTNYIAAQKDISALGPEYQVQGEKLDDKTQAKLEEISKKNGFANLEDFEKIAANIGLVMAGLDPQTGAFTDPVEALKKELEDIKKDASIPEKDKKQMVDELTDAIKSTPPLQFKENIDVVKKHRDAIDKVFQ